MFVFVIKETRQKKKISISKLSEMTDISRTYIRELENNKRLNVSMQTLYKIANALNVNIKKLFYTKFDINKLKRKMYRRIDKHGIGSQEALEVSQLIDLLINIDMNE